MPIVFHFEQVFSCFKGMLQEVEKDKRGIIHKP